ncbi:MAG: ABC transporter permease [Candidatus Acidiferrum sp.]
MNWLRELARRLGMLIHRRQFDDDLDEEMRLHLELRQQEQIKSGLNPEDARAAARRRFGNLTSVKEKSHLAWGWGWFEQFARDLCYGLRMLRKSPGFTCAAVLTVALGIGANTAIFSAVYGVVIQPLPYPDSERLVAIWSTAQGNRNEVAPADYLDWKRDSTVFQGLGAMRFSSVTLSDPNSAEQVQAGRTTPGFLTMIGIPMTVGRDFLPDEGEPEKDHVVILSYELWRDRYGAQKDILGLQIRLDGEAYTVVGVTGPAPTDRGRQALFTSLAFKPDQLNRDSRWLLVQGRLKAGVTIDQASAQMASIAQRIAKTYPRSNAGWGARVEFLHNDFLSRNLRSALLLLMGAVGFLLLIACANVASLLLARGASRQREVAVRASLGATSAQLFRQFLTESLSLGVLGGTLGVALAWALLKAIVWLVPHDTLPSESRIALQVPVLLFTLGLTLFGSLAFGSAPAWRATRLNPAETLKEGARSTGGSSRDGLLRTLVVVEFAVALILLTGGGLAVRSFWRVAHVNLGFGADHVLTFFLPVPPKRLPQADEISTFYRGLLQEIDALPGVTSSAASEGLPLGNAGLGFAFSIAGESVGDPAARPKAALNLITPGFNQTLGIRMARGRAFTEQDISGGERVAMVNEAFVERYLSGVDPLVQQVLVEQLIPGSPKPGPPVPWRIVGVYQDVRNVDARNEPAPEIDLPFWQSPWPSASVAVHTGGDPTSVRSAIAADLHAMDPDLPMDDVMTMDQIVSRSMDGERFDGALFGAFSGIGLLLATVGIYGVMAFVVSQRTHEIGVRMALGALPGKVLALILKEGMALALAGLAVGLAGSLLVGRIMQSRLFGAGAMDAVSFGWVALALFAAALLACFVPARRATHVDPMVALRHE